MSDQAIIEALKSYILKNHPSSRTFTLLPLNESLYEKGILDSFGIVELVSYIENNWSIRIADAEINKDQFSSIQRIANLIEAKLAPKKA